jgi:hypothetical protein
MKVDDRECAITRRYRMRHKIPELLSVSVFCSGLFSAVTRAPAQTPLASNVLVVYASNDPDSTAVGAYYADRRGIPPSHLCPVTLPAPAITALNGPDSTIWARGISFTSFWPTYAPTLSVPARDLITTRWIRTSPTSGTNTQRKFSTRTQPKLSPTMPTTRARETFSYPFNRSPLTGLSVHCR